MALNIKRDAPELTEAERAVQSVKIRVREVAEKYAKRHNLCSVVDEALEEAGIPTSSSEETVMVDLEYTVTNTHKQRYSVPVSLVANLSPEEEKEALATFLKGANGARNRPHEGEFVVLEAEIYTPPPRVSQDGYLIPETVNGLQSPQGDQRIMHLGREGSSSPICGSTGGGWGVVFRPVDPGRFTGRRVCRNCVRSYRNNFYQGLQKVEDAS